jgi:hypothetical protein
LLRLEDWVRDRRDYNWWLRHRYAPDTLRDMQGGYEEAVDLEAERRAVGAAVRYFLELLPDGEADAAPAKKPARDARALASVATPERRVPSADAGERRGMASRGHALRAYPGVHVLSSLRRWAWIAVVSAMSVGTVWFLVWALVVARGHG